jgi:hypothetical protein
MEEFTERLIALLEGAPAPGSNAAARALALPFDWRRLVASIDWEGLTGARPGRSLP